MTPDEKRLKEFAIRTAIGTELCELVGIDPKMIQSINLRVDANGASVVAQLMPALESNIGEGLPGAIRRFKVIEIDASEATGPKLGIVRDISDGKRS